MLNLLDVGRLKSTFMVAMLAGTLVASSFGAWVGWKNHLDHERCEPAQQSACSIVVLDENRSVKEIRDELERNKDLLVENGVQLVEFLEMLEHVKRSSPKQSKCIIPCLLEVIRIKDQLSRLMEIKAPIEEVSFRLKQQSQLCRKLSQLSVDWDK